MKDAYLAVVEDSYDVYVVEHKFGKEVRRQCMAKDVNFEGAGDTQRTWDKLINDLGLNNDPYHGYFATSEKTQIIHRL